MKGPAEAHWYLGQLYKGDGKIEQANKEFRRFRDLRPDTEGKAAADRVIEELEAQRDRGR